MKKLAALLVAGAMAASMVPAMSVYAAETESTVSEATVSETTVSEAPDYSQEDCWLSFPEISKDVDTFYIYSTQFSLLSPGQHAVCR